MASAAATTDGATWSPFYVTLPYELYEAQDPNSYLRHIGTYADQLAGKGAVEHISARSPDDMVAQLNCKLAPGDTIKELVIGTHGNTLGTFFLPSDEVR
ncbi:hypothetical protein [Micromonospora sp. NPDC049282]|uniref:hypothetical protein n=1 Tax=Micromonospora sp. NPDC049282 TaxID=3364269 RepID=UPI003718D306